MRRGVIVADRCAGIVLALALLTAGGLAIGWQSGRIPDAPTSLRIRDLTSASWLPWATGAGGILLVVLGLWWLISHLPRRIGGNYHLSGTDRTGRLTADAHAAATAAAKALALTPGIRTGSGRIVADRGQLVAELQCTIEPSADLAVVQAAATRVAADLHQILGRPELHHRLDLRVARSDKTTPPARVT